MQPGNSKQYGDQKCLGIEAYHSPQEIPVGSCLQADNLYPQANRYYLRPGFQGQFAAALGHPVYAITPVEQIDGTFHLWFACNGNLYKFIPDGAHTSPSQITYSGMPTLDTFNVTICAYNGYVYVADGTVNPMMRFAAAGTVGVDGAPYTGLAEPAAPSPVALTQLDLLGTIGALTWVSDDVYTIGNLVTSTNNHPTSSNVGASGSGKYWIGPTRGTYTFPTFPSDGTRNGIYLFQTNNTPLAMASPVHLGASAIAGVYPQVFQVLIDAEMYPNSGATNPSRAQFTMLAYDSTGTTLIGEQTVDIGPIVMGSIQTYSATFDFRGLDVRYVALQVAEDNYGATGTYANSDIIFDNVRLYAGGWGFAFANSSGTLVVQSGTVYASPPGNVTSNGAISQMTPQPQLTALYTRGQRLYTNAPSTIPVAGYSNWGPTSPSPIQRIVMNINQIIAPPSPNTIPVRLYIENAAGTRAYSGETTLSTESTAVSFDLTVVDPAITEAVTRLGLEFSDDIVTDGYVGNFRANPTGSPPILNATSLENPGNLSVGISINYVLVEINGSTDTTNLLNIILSDGSNFSTTITPTLTQAVALVSLPAKTNSTSDYYYLYRFGDFPDGYGRLLALLKWTGADFVVPHDPGYPLSGPPYAQPVNPYIAQTTTGGVITITDNTPSSWLVNADLYESGRTQPPLYIRDIVAWRGRLWVIAGQISGLTSPATRQSSLWGSWLIPEDQQAGLYFSATTSITDPSVAIKGFAQQPVGPQNNDIALRIVPMSSFMAILLQRMPPMVLQGSGPSDWLIADFPLGGAQSVGLIGRLAASITSVPLNVRNVFIQPVASLVYANPNGISAYDTIREPREVSLNIRNLIAPQLANLAAYNPAALAQVCIWYHGSHFYIAYPGVPGDTVPTVIYRYEEPNNEFGAQGGGQVNGIWSRWYSPSFNPTCGAMAPNAGDNAGHYIGGADGQLYLCVPTAGDKVTSGASAVGIPFAFQTRAYGYDTPFNLKTPSWVDIDFEYNYGEADLPLTVGVTGRQNASWSQTYTLQETNLYSAAGNNIDHMSLMAGFASGEVLTVNLSGSPLNAFIFGALRLTAVIGGGRRR